MVGFCRGSRAPTGSPVQYTGTCQFNKCVIEPEGGDPVPCVIGQQGCTCDSEGDCTKRPDLEICTLEDVEPFSTSTEYVENDVVRIGTKRFKVSTMSVFIHMFTNITLMLPLLVNYIMDYSVRVGLAVDGVAMLDTNQVSSPDCGNKPGLRMKNVRSRRQVLLLAKMRIYAVENIPRYWTYLVLSFRQLVIF